MIALARVSLVAVLALPAISCGQDKTAPGRRTAAQPNGLRAGELQRTQDRHQDPQGEPATPGKDVRRLESVTWDSVKHQLTWVISKGGKESGTYKADRNMKYEISMDDATMTYNGETRRFSKDEAANVHVLMDLISKYAVDSTVWWDDGHGEPVDGKKVPTKDSASVLHVSLQQPPDARALQQRIDDLQQKLAALQFLQRLMQASSPTRLSSY